MCAVYMVGVYRVQERAMEFLELELQAVVSGHVGLGNRARSSARITNTLTAEE